MLFFAIDPAISQKVGLDLWTDQECMEKLVESMVAASEFFEEDSTRFKNIADWPGIICDDSGSLSSIEWISSYIAQEHHVEYEDEEKTGVISAGGSIFLNLLPSQLKNIYLQSLSLEGTIETKDLPRCLVNLDMKANKLHGTFDIVGLPQNMVLIGLGMNVLHGNLQLHALPHSISCFFASKNRFSGCVDLTKLPRALKILHLGRNALSGSIELINLPPKLMTLSVHGNRFKQEALIVETLPRTTLIVKVGRAQFGRILSPKGEPVHNSKIQ